MRRLFSLSLSSWFLFGCVFPSSGDTSGDGADGLDGASTGGAVASETGGSSSSSGGSEASPAGGGASGGMVGAATGGAAAGTGGKVTVGPCDYPASDVREVSSAAALQAALDSADPGDMIRLSGGTFSGNFTSSRSGTAGAPIVLCSEAGATLEADSDNKDTFNLAGSHWVLSGFTVTGGLRGVVLDGANFNTISRLTVHSIGQEAIHLRSHSSDNVVEACRIYNTRTETASFGEGIYIGSAKSNWNQYTGSSNTPDRSDRNIIIDNVIGPNVRAEHIDVKEGTQGGILRGNSFDGTGISGQNYADSWVDIKGNDYLVEANYGENSPLDGFQTHVVDDDWGHDIVFKGNTAIVNGPGHGFSISSDSDGVIVGCDNEVSGAGEGLSNRSCAVIP